MRSSAKRDGASMREIREEVVRREREDASNLERNESVPESIVSETVDCAADRPMVRTRGVPRYYAIAVGRHPGIYVSWEAASKQVLGFWNNRHEMFKHRSEA